MPNRPPAMLQRPSTAGARPQKLSNAPIPRKSIRIVRKASVTPEEQFDLNQLDDIIGTGTAASDANDPFFDLSSYETSNKKTDENDWLNWALNTLDNATKNNVPINEMPSFELVCEEIDEAVLDQQFSSLMNPPGGGYQSSTATPHHNNNPVNTSATGGGAATQHQSQHQDNNNNAYPNTYANTSYENSGATYNGYGGTEYEGTEYHGYGGTEYENSGEAYNGYGGTEGNGSWGGYDNNEYPQSGYGGTEYDGTVYDYSQNYNDTYAEGYENYEGEGYATENDVYDFVPNHLI